jgi:hypothetical protein
MKTRFRIVLLTVLLSLVVVSIFLPVGNTVDAVGVTVYGLEGTGKWGPSCYCPLPFFPNCGCTWVDPEPIQ